ncbi:hypothetical protein EON79_11860 [bacterium]|nr:MAG: hypothetical protein EON79_11860 [bacterium]
MIRRPIYLAFLLASAALMPALAPAQKFLVWGRNEYGQGTNEFDSKAAQLTGGGLFSVMMFASGRVYAWGNNDFGQTAYPINLIAKQIDSGGNHTLVVTDNGTVTGWGFGQQNQLAIPAGLSATAVSAGGNFSMALRTDGTVAAWGDNIYGQVNVPAGLVATRISAGSYYALALRTDGTVAAWGQSNDGQCNVPFDLTATWIAAGAYHSLAVRTDGTVAAWGRNAEGQTNVPAGLTATQVAAGTFHSLALRKDGTVAAWGQNTDGQCNVPAGLTGVIEISTGGYHSFALVASAHCILNQKEVFAGGSATGTIKVAHLESSAYDIGLVATDPRIHVPAAVTIPYGSYERTFPVTTDVFVGPDVDATIYTVNNNVPVGSVARKTVAYPIKVKGAKVTAAFASASVIGGSNVKPKLTATLESTATHPITIAVYNPQKTVAVPILGTSRVSSPRTVAVELRSTAGATVATANLTVNPLRANVTFTAPTLTGGESGKGGVYLNASVVQPLNVRLTSGDPSVSVPSSVTIAAGARIATFPITTHPVAANLTVPITATILGNPFASNLKLLAMPAVRSLTLPTSVSGNGKITGTVRLTISGRAGGTVVELSSSSSGLSVPATVIVPEGQYAATFVATAADVASADNATVTASTPLGSASAGVAVNPLSVDAIALSTSTASSGATVTITVNLNAPVSVATPVSLTSADNSLVPVPATITIPTGSKTATITVTLGSTATAKNVKITATKHATSQYRTLKVNP